MTEQSPKSCKLTLDEILETEWIYSYVREIADEVIAKSRENIKPRLKVALQAKRKELQNDLDELQEAIDEIDNVIGSI